MGLKNFCKKAFDPTEHLRMAEKQRKEAERRAAKALKLEKAKREAKEKAKKIEKEAKRVEDKAKKIEKKIRDPQKHIDFHTKTAKKIVDEGIKNAHPIKMLDAGKEAVRALKNNNTSELMEKTLTLTKPPVPMVDPLRGYAERVITNDKTKPFISVTDIVGEDAFNLATRMCHRAFEKDAKGKWKALPEKLITVLMPYYPEINFSRVRYTCNKKSMGVAVGRALRYDIYFPNEIDFSIEWHLRILLHELEHVAQYVRGGEAFYKKYTDEYLLRRIETRQFDMSDQMAVHDMISFEKEANAKEGIINEVYDAYMSILEHDHNNHDYNNTGEVSQAAMVDQSQPKNRTFARTNTATITHVHSSVSTPQPRRITLDTLNQVSLRKTTHKPKSNDGKKSLKGGDPFAFFGASRRQGRVPLRQINSKPVRTHVPHQPKIELHINTTRPTTMYSQRRTNVARGLKITSPTTHAQHRPNVASRINTTGLTTDAQCRANAPGRMASPTSKSNNSFTFWRANEAQNKQVNFQQVRPVVACKC